MLAISESGGRVPAGDAFDLLVDFLIIDWLSLMGSKFETYATVLVDSCSYKSVAVLSVLSRDYISLESYSRSHK